MKTSKKKWNEPSTPVMPQQQNAWHPVTVRELREQRERFNIDPPFQRKQAWNRRQCQQLYETMFQGRPIGTLEGYRENTAMEGGTVFGIIDGHQRITAILRFVDNNIKTWTYPQKLQLFPGSEAPKQPGRFFRDLDVNARNYFLDYRVDINLIPKMTDHELVERFLEIQCHVPLSPAERLYAYPSKAKELAKRIGSHLLWDGFYAGERHRGQVFQSCLCLLAIELQGGIADLRGQSVYINSLACGKRDDEITTTVEQRVRGHLDEVCLLFSGMQFTDRIASVVMYQAVMKLKECGYQIKTTDRGKLTTWILNIINESKQVMGIPVYNQPIQRLLYASSQKVFWEHNLKVVLRLMDIPESQEG